MEKEIWKPIKRYEGLYEVSNYGRVRSLDAMLPVKGKNGEYYRKRVGRILRQPNSSKGYKQVILCDETGNQIFRVHRLVAEAFIDNPENLPAVNHKDEDKTNNYVENLEWCTTKYNNTYGNKIKRGELHPMSKLDSRQVKEIREKRNSGETIVQIADQFGISRSHVCGIVNNRFWRANE